MARSFEGKAFNVEKLGSCDFVDVLEEAVVRHLPVRVHPREGEAFVDEVVDVVTEGGKDFAVFKDHERMVVGEIRTLIRAESPAPR